MSLFINTGKFLSPSGQESVMDDCQKTRIILCQESAGLDVHIHAQMYINTGERRGTDALCWCQGQSGSELCSVLYSNVPK